MLRRPHRPQSMLLSSFSGVAGTAATTGSTLAVATTCTTVTSLLLLLPVLLLLLPPSRAPPPLPLALRGRFLAGQRIASLMVLIPLLPLLLMPPFRACPRFLSGVCAGGAAGDAVFRSGLPAESAEELSEGWCWAWSQLKPPVGGSSVW